MNVFIYTHNLYSYLLIKTYLISACIFSDIAFNLHLNYEFAHLNYTTPQAGRPIPKFS